MSILNITVIYRSQNRDLEELRNCINSKTSEDEPELIIGDFNYCYMSSTNNSTKQYLRKNNFSQLVKKPTHIEGNLLDHAYVRDIRRCNEYFIDLQTKYFTDHKGITVVVRKT